MAEIHKNRRSARQAKTLYRITLVAGAVGVAVLIVLLVILLRPPWRHPHTGKQHPAHHHRYHHGHHHNGGTHDHDDHSRAHYQGPDNRQHRRAHPTGIRYHRALCAAGRRRLEPAAGERLESAALRL